MRPGGWDPGHYLYLGWQMAQPILPGATMKGQCLSPSLPPSCHWSLCLDQNKDRDTDPSIDWFCTRVWKRQHASRLQVVPAHPLIPRRPFRAACGPRAGLARQPVQPAVVVSRRRSLGLLAACRDWWGAAGDSSTSLSKYRTQRRMPSGLGLERQAVGCTAGAATQQVPPDLGPFLAFAKAHQVPSVLGPGHIRHRPACSLAIWLRWPATGNSARLSCADGYLLSPSGALLFRSRPASRSVGLLIEQTNKTDPSGTWTSLGDTSVAAGPSSWDKRGRFLTAAWPGGRLKHDAADTLLRAGARSGTGVAEGRESANVRLPLAGGETSVCAGCVASGKPWRAARDCFRPSPHQLEQSPHWRICKW